MKWVLLLGSLFLVGCPKNVTVTGTWTGTGNPQMPVCGTVPVPPCLLNYSITNNATGALIATIPMLDANGKPILSYSFTASTSGMTGATLGLAVNEQTASGVVRSPKALSSVTVN